MFIFSLVALPPSNSCINPLNISGKTAMEKNLLYEEIAYFYLLSDFFTFLPHVPSLHMILLLRGFPVSSLNCHSSKPRTSVTMYSTACSDYQSTFFLFQIINPLITALIYAPYRLTLKRFLINIPIRNRPLYYYRDNQTDVR